MTTNHIVRDTAGNIIQIKCKFCRTVIQDLVPFDNPRTTNVRRALDSTIIREVRMIFKPLATYGELTLICDDGTKHVTHACKTCIAKYKNDMIMLTMGMQIDIDELHEHGLPGEVHKSWIARTVKGVE